MTKKQLQKEMIRIFRLKIALVRDEVEKIIVEEIDMNYQWFNEGTSVKDLVVQYGKLLENNFV